MIKNQKLPLRADLSLAKKFKIRNFLRGYTLVEMIIVIMLFSILGVAVASFVYMYVQNNNFLLNQRIEAEVQNYHWNTLSDIETSVRGAKRILSNKTVDSDFYQTSSSTLVLELCAIDSNQNILENYFDYIIYFPDSAATNTIMKRSVISASSSRPFVFGPLNTNVDSLRFFYNNQDLASTTKITIGLKTQKSYEGITKTASTTMEAALR